MRYLVLLKALPPDTPPPTELMTAIMQLGEEATADGRLVDTAGLLPSAAGARVSLTGRQLSVTDGPFAEAREMISYAVWDVPAKADAIEATSRFLELHRDLWPGWEGEADVLQVMGPEDFGGPAGPQA
jgi:hypothetical protein